MVASVKDLRRHIARDLMLTQPGQRLPPLREVAGALGASLGSTQTAMASLVAEGAIRLDSRPRRGAILLARDVGRLFRAARPEPLVVSMSLPSTERINGLATGVRAVLTAAGVDCQLAFMRGSQARLAALRSGRADIAVTSALAAEGQAGPDLETILILPPHSFVLDHRVFSMGDREAGSARLRVAIDRGSYDFERLTTMEFAGRDVEMLSLNYLTTIRHMDEGAIDVAILDVEDALMRFPPHVRSRPLGAEVIAALDGANTRAAFVARRADPFVAALVRSAIDGAAIAGIQAEVIAGDRPPEY
jgi:hypothetical protein